MVSWNKFITAGKCQNTANIFLIRRLTMWYVPGIVILSKSKDIYRNLAFEDWLYKNLCFKDLSPGVLLMWRNRPAVVIGRHQNPWLECKQGFAKEKGINLARRNSGGGTVYHDEGNLNCSFLTSRSNYNRKDNLKVICAALQKKWNFDVSISKREDIVLQNMFKISGTASKLGSQNAYHHCTILVSVDRHILKEVLTKNRDGLKSKATESIRSKVKNLRELYSHLTVDDVCSEVGHQYQEFHKIQNGSILSVYPNEEEFPGINDIIEHLKSWKWIYGWTPRFTISRNFIVDNNSKFLNNSNGSTKFTNVLLEIGVYHGCIEHVSLTPQLANKEAYSALQKSLQGIHFLPEHIFNAAQIWAEKYIDYDAIKKLIMKTVEKAFI